MERTKADVFRYKIELLEFTNCVKNFLESSTPEKSPLGIFFDIDKKTVVLVDYIINNEDENLAKEVLEIDMSLWDKIKEYADLDLVELIHKRYDENDKIKEYLDLDPLGNDWGLMRKIKEVEKNVFVLREWSRSREEETSSVGKRQTNNECPEPQLDLKDFLPERLKSNEAVEVFQKAIDAKLIINGQDGLKWNDTKLLLAYFATKVSKVFSLTTIYDKDMKLTTAWKPFEDMFKMQGLKNSKQNWMRINTKFEPTGFEKVDALF